MRHLSLLLFLALLLCPSQAIAEVKNVDSAVFELKPSTGKGKTVPEALKQAKEAAVDQAVETLFAQVETERARYREARSDLLVEADQFVPELRMTDKYRDGEQVVVEVRGQVQRDRLRQALVKHGVIQELEKALPIHEQPRVLVLLTQQGASDPLGKFAVSRVNEYLTRQHLEVVDSETVRQLLEDERVTERPELAIQSQADVYLMVDVTVKHTRDYGALSLFQSTVEISAYAPLTAEPLETARYQSRELTFPAAGDSEKSRRAAVEEAIGGSLEPITRTVQKAAKESRLLGRLYSLKVRAPEARIRELGMSLRDACKSVSRSSAAGSTLFAIRYAGALEDLLERIVGSSRGWTVVAESQGAAELSAR